MPEQILIFFAMGVTILIQALVIFNMDLNSSYENRRNETKITYVIVCIVLCVSWFRDIQYIELQTVSFVIFVIMMEIRLSTMRRKIRSYIELVETLGGEEISFVHYSMMFEDIETMDDFNEWKLAKTLLKPIDLVRSKKMFTPQVIAKKLAEIHDNQYAD